MRLLFQGTAQGRLSSRISRQLALAALLAAVFEIAIVFMLYSADRQKLGEQLISRQARRIAAILTVDGPRAATLGKLASPTGAQSFAFSIYDSAGERLFATPEKAGNPSTDLPVLENANSTRALGVPGTAISGVRLISGNGRQYAVAITITGDEPKLFLPVFAEEALDHVILPLVPLTTLLLIVNIIIVRCGLAPLTIAAKQAEQIGPAQMDVRLSVPSGGREIGAIVDAVNQAFDRLQQAMRTLEGFTADAAHELRTPLSVLRLRVDALPESVIKNSLTHDIIAMTRLVSQMLDLARADTLAIGKDDRVDLASMIRDVVVDMAPLAFAADRELSFVTVGSSEIAGHREALARVVRNLVDNALAHSPAHGAVRVEAGPGPRFSVRDHGPGITADPPNHIFRRFWRGPGQTSEGAGLGLAIAESIIAKHGATIDAANAPNGGALFTVVFPHKEI